MAPDLKKWWVKAIRKWLVGWSVDWSIRLIGLKSLFLKDSVEI